MENITQRIFRLAAERDVKQVDIATACDLPPTTVNSWKSRNIIPPSDVIIPICQLLEVSPEFLLAGWDSHYPDEAASLPDDELALLNSFRACSEEGKMIVRASAIMEARRNEGVQK